MLWQAGRDNSALFTEQAENRSNIAGVFCPSQCGRDAPVFEDNTKIGGKRHNHTHGCERRYNYADGCGYINHYIHILRVRLVRNLPLCCLARLIALSPLLAREIHARPETLAEPNLIQFHEVSPKGKRGRDYERNMGSVAAR